MADVFPVTAPLYYDAAGNLREAVGVVVVPDTTYRDAAGNVRGAIGVNIVGGGGGGDLPSNQAIVENGTSVMLGPAPGNVGSLGPVYIDVLGNVASFWLSDNRTAVTNGDTAPVQNSAGAAIATGTFRIVGNAITYIRLPATVAGVSNGGSVSVRNSAGADAHPATAVVASGALTGVNLAATSAMIDNGDIVTATSGQTIDIGVAAGVPSFTVRSFPFWEPFTVTAGDLASWTGGDTTAFGYVKDVAGSISNEPIAGFEVQHAYTDADGLHLVIRGPRPVGDMLAGGVMGISAVDYPLEPEDGDFGVSSEIVDDGVYETRVDLDVPPWTLAQQVPIVTLPWVAP